eukprot:scaffold6233_cov129-Amphora_coffeaeformis.AAC.1
MNRRGHGCMGLDDAQFPKNARFQIGKAGPLARPTSPSRDGHGSHDTKIQRFDVFKADAFAVLDKALGRGGQFERNALVLHDLRVDAQIGKVLGQVRDGRVQHLALIQGPQTDGNLGWIGIALDRPSPLPFRGLGQTPRGRIGTDEIRNV